MNLLPTAGLIAVSVLTTISVSAGSVFDLTRPSGAVFLPNGNFATVDGITLSIQAMADAGSTNNPSPAIHQTKNGIGVFTDFGLKNSDRTGDVTMLDSIGDEKLVFTFIPGPVLLETMTFELVQDGDNVQIDTATFDLGALRGTNDVAIVNAVSLAMVGNAFEVSVLPPSIGGQNEVRIASIEVSGAAISSTPIPTPAAAMLGVPAACFLLLRRQRTH